MSDLYAQGRVSMGDQLIIPESFEEALSYAEQLIWLYLNKQSKLVEGGGVTLTDNADGTTTISVSSDIKGIESIESTVGATKTVVKITLTDGSVETFDVMAGPQGPAGADGRQGVDGVGISSVVYASTVTEDLDVEVRTITSGGVDISPSEITVPRYSVYTVTYTNGNTSTLNIYAGSTMYIRRITINETTTPKQTTYLNAVYDPVTNNYTDTYYNTIKDGEKGDSGDFPSGGENGNVLVKNSNATDGVEWISPDRLSPRVGSWHGSAASIQESPIPSVIEGHDYPDYEHTVPIDINFELVTTSDEVTGIRFTAHNDSEYLVEVTNIEFGFQCTPNETPTITDVVSPTYGSGGFWYDSVVGSLIKFGWSGQIPAGETEEVECSISNVQSGFFVDIVSTYTVQLLNAKNGVPDASQASSGDVLTADGTGGCGWQTPSGGGPSVTHFNGEVITNYINSINDFGLFNQLTLTKNIALIYPHSIVDYGDNVIEIIGGSRTDGNVRAACLLFKMTFTQLTSDLELASIASGYSKQQLWLRFSGNNGMGEKVVPNGYGDKFIPCTITLEFKQSTNDDSVVYKRVSFPGVTRFYTSEFVLISLGKLEPFTVPAGVNTVFVTISR